ncbi:MAG: TIGR03915 family putative DNA repair protein [Bacillota bacterium]
MIYYIFDNTYEGLLTAIYEAFYRDQPPDHIVRRCQYEPGLFSREIEIKTDREKADKVSAGIKDRISGKSRKWIYYAFLSEVPHIDTEIYRYLKLGFARGQRLEKLLTNDLVLKIKGISKKVGREKHRLLGLLRFRRLSNGIFYAPFESDYNVITLMAPHFAGRMSDQEWIIHDRSRGLAVLYNKEEWILTEIIGEPGLDYAEDEELYQDLWQEFFETVALRQRENPGLQRQYMPRRYWKYLIEEVD